MEVIYLEKLVIQGGTRLHGEVIISGAKNAAVAIIPATLLINGICTIENLPNISDVQIQCKRQHESGYRNDGTCGSRTRLYAEGYR